MVEDDREEITPEQLAKLKERNGPNFKLDVQVKGVAVIKDKNGNIKSTMDIVSFEED